MTVEHETKSWQEAALERYYKPGPGWVNGTVEFWDFIKTHAAGCERVLELGPGPSNPTSEFLAKTFKQVDGLDMDAAASGNTYLAKAWIYPGSGSWPFPEAAYDAVVSNFVLEHVERPDEMLRETVRVLKPGGRLLFRTPNLWHYITLTSRLTPHWFHKLVANRLRGVKADAGDVYPTYYRMNTRRRLRRLWKSRGLTEIELRMIEKEPSYGMCSRLAFYPFMLHERLVNSSKLFADCRVCILGAARKTG
jgi:SAM-dependent methyltransferase